MLEVLLIDDEPSIRLSLGDTLRDAGHRVDVAADGAEGLKKVATKVYDVVITDVRMPKVDGLTVFKRIRAESPETDVILITAYGAVADAVGALKEGAYDYLTKPVDTDEIVVRVARSEERRRLRNDLAEARTALAEKSTQPKIIGRSPQMVRLIDRLDTIAASDSGVLVTGESGTGKELVARRLHDMSSRKDKPFVAVNCAAFPETLLEAELFGHEKGAFTGAAKKRDGRFKAADGGTLFLDEIAELPPAAQAKLLRVLQEGTVEPLGTNAPIHVDVRVIAATHQNLKDRIAQKLFREDLYYRLKVLDLSIPALRERRGDLPLLVEAFLRELGPKGGPTPTIAPRAWAALSEYAFPGNVRELRHAIERAIVLSRGGEIDLEHLPEDLVGEANMPTTSSVRSSDELRPLATAIKEFEHQYLVRALAAAGGKKAKAAEMLDISRKNLWEKLKQHGIASANQDDA